MGVPKQLALFEVELSYPYWIDPEPWMKDLAIIEALVAGQVRCARCLTVLSMGAVDVYPVQFGDDLICLSCHAELNGYAMRQCEDCGGPVIADPAWRFSHWDADDIPSLLVARFWDFFEIWDDPFDESGDQVYVCGKCLLERHRYWGGTLPVEAESCVECGRVFPEGSPNYGYWEDDVFVCLKCWEQLVIEDGFSEVDFRDRRWLSGDRKELLESKGYVLIATWPIEEETKVWRAIKKLRSQLDGRPMVVTQWHTWMGDRGWRWMLWVKPLDDDDADVLGVASALSR